MLVTRYATRISATRFVLAESASVSLAVFFCLSIFFSIATIATPLFSFIRSLRLLHLVEPMLVPHADWTPVTSITLVRLLWHQAFSVSDDQYWCDSSGERLVWSFEIFFASSNASSTNRKIRS